jgi:hypothetical protein
MGLTRAGLCSRLVPASRLAAIWWCGATRPRTYQGCIRVLPWDNDGEAVFLYNSATVRVDAVSFGLQIADLSLGRLADGWGLCHPHSRRGQPASDQLGRTDESGAQRMASQSATGRGRLDRAV